MIKDIYKGFDAYVEFLNYYEKFWLKPDMIKRWNYYDMLLNENREYEFELIINYLESFNNQILLKNHNVQFNF